MFCVNQPFWPYTVDGIMKKDYTYTNKKTQNDKTRNINVMNTVNRVALPRRWDGQKRLVYYLKLNMWSTYCMQNNDVLEFWIMHGMQIPKEERNSSSSLYLLGFSLVEKVVKLLAPSPAALTALTQTWYCWAGCSSDNCILVLLLLILDPVT